MKAERYTNQQELKAQTKRIIEEVGRGERYVVTRYSDPVAVLLSMEDYRELNQNNPHRCRQCRGEIKKTLAKINQKL